MAAPAPPAAPDAPAAGAPAAAPPPLPARYRPRRELGRGGMGAVYLADDERLGRPVAVKVLAPDAAGDGALRERFVREARLVAAFAHPNIVPVYEVDEHAGRLLYVMAYVEGESLAERVARGGPLPAGEAVRVLRDVAWALAHAHARGVVHRDVKPDNVLLERATGRAMLADFGIARAHAAADRAPAAATAALTRVGEVVGTPQYMSPEQATGDAVDARTDLYAFGATAYVALAGRPPFAGPTPRAVLVQQLTQPPPDLGAARPDLPAPLVALVARCLAQDPAARPADARVVVDALDALAAARPAVPPTLRLLEATSGPALVALLVVLASAGFVPSMDYDADRRIAAVILLVLALTAVARLVGLARLARRQGLPLAATRAGLAALAVERAEAGAVARLGGARRPGLRNAALAAVGIASAAVGRGMRVQYAPGLYSVPPGAGVLLMLGYALVTAALCLHLLKADRRTLASRLAAAFWRSPLGGLVFAAAGERGGANAGRPVVPLGAAPAPTPAPPPAPPLPAAPAAVTARPARVLTPVTADAAPPARAEPRADARAEALAEAARLADALRDALARAGASTR